MKPLKWYKKLATGKGRLEAGAFLVEGDRAVRQITGSHPEAVMEIITIEEPSADYRSYPIRIVTESQFRSICLTSTPQGMLAVIRLPEDAYSGHLPDDPGHRVLLMEDIQDPGNVGSLIRTAAAFGFSGAILTQKCADPFSPKCVQATAGTLLSTWIRRTADYLDLVLILKNKGYSFAAADIDGQDDPSVMSSKDKLLLALGNEARGLSHSVVQTSDYRIRIPIDRQKTDSLNVAACGAICMYLSTQNKIHSN